MRRGRNIAGIVLVSRLLIACGDGENGSPTQSTSRPAGHGEELCNGTAGLRFAATSQVSISDNAVGSYVLYELGVQWIFVDGQCQYWAHVNNVTGDDWRPVREGVLTEAEAREIESRFLFAQWSELAGSWTFPSTVAHGAVEVFYNDQNTIRCENCCGDLPIREYGSGLDQVCQLSQHRFELVERLYAKGTDVVSGPLRLMTYLGRYPDESVDEDRTPSNVTAIEWPLREPIDSVALSMAQIGPTSTLDYGDSYLVTDDAATAALRQGRAKFLAGELGPLHSNMMVVRPPESDQRYALYFRDTIPLEGSRGLVEMP